MSPLGVVDDCVMLAPTDNYNRKQRIGLAIRLRLQIRDDREFTEVELFLTDKRLERRIRHLHVRKIKTDQWRMNLAVLQCCTVRIRRKQRPQRHRFSTRCRNLIARHRLRTYLSAKAGYKTWAVLAKIHSWSCGEREERHFRARASKSVSFPAVVG